MDQIKGIGSSLVMAAGFNTRTSARLARLAEKHMDDLEAAGDLGGLPALAALGRTANDMAAIGTAMMAANAKTPQEPLPEYAPLRLERLTDEELTLYIALTKKVEG